ncbi:MAG TPA: bifunctional 3-(3-hydroxy-phenyl)propionate/3-hydroxycinnamic acid hydroxylase [Alphaproteobacteria bacterium]|nr:bifunctional 3-(3-hydroxy-phenyl)propionate/3-hydroxycinnamic acid hydroxylase [Alphaproteobacteria bacterium]
MSDSAERLSAPVLVVGAGPAGLTLANLLGRYGVETILIEQHQTTVQEPRAVSIDDESLRTMQAAGMIDEVAKDVILGGYGYHYFTRHGRRFAQVLPTAADYGYPRRCPFQQPLFEATLREGLKRFPHVTALFGHKLTGFTQDESGVTASVARDDGTTLQIRAAYLAACDGGSSPIRKLLGIPLVGSSFEERWVVLDIVNRRDSIQHTHVYCSAARPAITLPGPHGTRRWEFRLRPEETDAEALKSESIKAMLALYGGDTEAEIVRQIVYTFHARTAERWRNSRVFLAGDAAHLTPPFAGQGMNSGIRDAHNLSWKLAAVTQGVLAAPLLDSYETERRDHAWSLIMMAVRMGQVMNPATRLREFLLVNAIRIANLVPSVRDYFMQMKFKPKPRFEKGFVVPDGLPPKKSLVGRMLPQPRVVAVDANAAGTGDAETLLDEITGPGFALLAYGADAVTALMAAEHPLWRRLDARRVALLPPDAKLPSPLPGGIFVALDRAGRFAKLFPSGQTRLLLLRPDRYVAAVFAPEQAESALAALCKLAGPHA